MIPHDPSAGASPERMEQIIDRLSDSGFVGRTFELQAIDALLSHAHERPERILNLYGTGGMGKTFLLEQFRKRSAQSGALFLLVDVRDCGHTIETVVAPIAERLGLLSATDSAPLHVRCIEAINLAALGQRVVIAFDHYEEIGGIDQWLREAFIPKLHAGVLLVFAGRFPLEGPWRISPSWRKLIVPLPLTELSYEESRVYLQREGFDAENAIDAIWVKTWGHPLSLSLYASAWGNGAGVRSAMAANSGRELPEFEALLAEWLREAPDDELRDLLLTASIPRSFNQETLASLSGEALTGTLFERLTRLSFVGRSARGWHLHERIRESLRESFRRRKPEAFARLNRKAAEDLYAAIGKLLAKKEDVSWEIAELLRHAKSPILRAHFRHARHSYNYLEAVTPQNAHEAQAYLLRRQKQASKWTIRCSDAETGSLFRYSLSAEESLYRLAGLRQIEELAALDAGALKLLRSREGEVAGLSAIVPIHEGTIGFLSRSPLSAAYFRSLPAKQLQSLNVAPGGQAGSFILAIDVENLENEELRSDIVHLMLGQMLSGQLLLASPPPLDYYKDAHSGYGFEPVPGVFHRDYDGITPTPTYVLDTRKEKLHAFVAKMIGAPESAGQTGKPQVPAWLPDLTPREKEAAALLVRGHTNKEIAAALFISEAAVKKHVNAILLKYGVKNRTQLANAVIGHTAPPR